MTPTTLRRRALSRRPRPAESAQRSGNYALTGVVATLLPACSAHDYAFTCGLGAGVLIGVVLAGVAMWVADAAWRGSK